MQSLQDQRSSSAGAVGERQAQTCLGRKRTAQTLSRKQRQKPTCRAYQKSRSAAHEPEGPISWFSAYSQLVRETLRLPLTDCSAHAKLITCVQQDASSGADISGIGRRIAMDHRVTRGLVALIMVAGGALSRAQGNLHYPV
jgi:hypothetical protein